MRFFQLFLLASLLIVLSSCSKPSNDSGGSGVSPPVKITPTNLVITSTVSTDNTGTVSFTAAATNATSYSYTFGDGGSTTVTSGSTGYKYAASGTYTVTVTAQSVTGQTTSQSITVKVTVNLSLVWSDEFNTPGPPDTTYWSYAIGNGVNGWGNNELEYYTNRTTNAVVADSALNIIAQKENYMGSNYTSAKLQSSGKFSFKYGYVEVRAQLPAGAGSWPGIWTLGNDFSTVGWPACGEMDIAEETANTPNVIYGTLHYIGNNPGSTTTVQNTQTAFHLYQLEWSPTQISILVDNVVYFTYANSNTTPFNQDFYMILNVAVGGTFGGTVDPNYTSGTMKIDYVRVYN